MKKILVVEDDRGYQEIYVRELGGMTTIISAYTPEEGERLFFENPDIVLVVMDACVPGDRVTTLPLVKKIREAFAGPMVAASGRGEYRDMLCKAGCSHQSPKWEVPQMVKELLGLSQDQ